MEASLAEFVSEVEASKKIMPPLPLIGASTLSAMPDRALMLVGCGNGMRHFKDGLRFVSGA